MLTRSLSVILLALVGSCDRGSAAPQGRPQTAAETAAETADPVAAPVKPVVEPESEPAPTLPEMTHVDESALKLGMSRLSSCSEYEAYVHRALEWHHLHRRFPAQFGKPIEPAFRSPLERPARRLAVDGDWLYREAGPDVFVVDIGTGGVHGVANKMFDPPAIQAAEDGWFALGRSSDLSGAKFETFARGENTNGWWKDAHGGRHPTYRSFRSSSWELYAREGDALRYKRAMGQSGELLRVQVEPQSRSIYVMTLTEPHVATAFAEGARTMAGSSEDFETLRRRLRELKVAAPEDSRPHYSYQVNPKGGRTEGASKHTQCSDVWVPNDDATTGERLLAVHRFDLDKLKYTSSWAVALDDFVAAIGGDRLYLARRLRGVTREGKIDQPIGEVDVFDLANDFALLQATRVEGVPGELSCNRSGCMLTTTRWPSVETLVYTLTGDGVSDPAPAEPERRLAPVIGTPDWDLWSAQLPVRFDVVFVVGQQTIAAKLREQQLEFEVFGPDGASVATATTESSKHVLKWEPDDVTTSATGFLVPVRALTDDGVEITALVGELREGGLALRWLATPKKQPFALTDEASVVVSDSGVEWVSPGGEPVREVKWRDILVTEGGRPTRAR